MRTILALILFSFPALAVDFVSGQSLGAAVRSDYTGYVGIRMHILQTVTTTTLGRWCSTGDSAAHITKLSVNPGGQSVTDVASVTITCPGGSAGWVYGAAVRTLTKGEDYFLSTQTTSGQVGFYDQGDTTVTTTTVARATSAAFYSAVQRTDNYGWNVAPSSAGHSFGPVGFQYTAPTAIPANTVIISDKRGNVLNGTTFTKYGVLQKAPWPRMTWIDITGTAGCSIAVADSDGGSGFSGYFWEDAGQTALAPIPATAMPMRFRIVYQNDWFSWGTAGNLDATITATLSGGAGCSGSASFTLRTVIVPPRVPPKVTYRTSDGAPPAACTVGDSAATAGPDRCVYPDDPYHSNTPLYLPAIGSTGVDAVWGNTITKYTNNLASVYKLHAYGAMTPFNVDSTHLFVENHGASGDGSTGGSENVIRLSDGVTRRIGIDDQSAAGIPSTIYNGTLEMEVHGSRIRKTVYDPSSYGNLSGYPEDYNMNVPPFNFVSMWTGGTSDMSGDGWAGFIEQGGKVCAIDANGIGLSNYLDHVYCGDFQLYHDSLVGGVHGPDAVHVSSKDIRTGDRYVIALNNDIKTGQWGSSVWRVNMAAHTLDFWVQPESMDQNSNDTTDGDGIFDTFDGERGIQTGHSDMASFDGKQYFCFGKEDQEPNAAWTTCYDLSTGADMTRPIEVGGGAYNLFRSGNQGHGSNHTSCAHNANICGVGFYGGGGRSGGTYITAVTAANPAVVTLAADPGLATGTNIVIGGLNAGSSYATCLEGVPHIGTRVDATHISLAGANCVGAGTFTSTQGLLGYVEFINDNYSSEFMMFDLDHIVRSIYTRDNLFVNTANYGYGDLPFAALSQDGQKVAFHSSMGFPEVQQYVTNTDYTVNDKVVPMVNAAATGAFASVKLTAARYCTFSAYDAAGSVVESHTSGTSITPFAVFTGLSADTQYMMRATCRMFSGDKFFRTSAAPSGSADVSSILLGTTGVADIVLDYGPTQALGTTTSPVSCAAGAQCKATVSATRGLLYVRARTRNGSGTTLVSGAITALRN